MFLLISILVLVAVLVALVVATRLVRWISSHLVTVPEGHVALAYRFGKYLRTLEAGGHWLWHWGMSTELVDVRDQVTTVAGQDVLTADQIGLKLSLALRYRVVDARAATHEVAHFSYALYQSAQLALRGVVGSVKMEDLLSQRLDLGKQLLEAVQAEANAYGVLVEQVAVRDVMFPADVRRSFAEVLKARNEGLASLERARGESAALRNLANAARVLEKNPTLLQLRLLRSIDELSDKGGNTLVFGVNDGLLNPNKNDKKN